MSYTDEQDFRHSFASRAVEDNLKMATNRFGHTLLSPDQANVLPEEDMQITVNGAGDIQANPRQSIWESDEFKQFATTHLGDAAADVFNIKEVSPSKLADEEIDEDDEHMFSFENETDAVSLLPWNTDFQDRQHVIEEKTTSRLKRVLNDAPIVAKNKLTSVCVDANCSAELPEGARFCSSCGCPQLGRFCVSCGYKYSGPEKFCPECGERR